MKPNSPSIKGFTLVEVTIALGLISFGLITMIGVMQTGISLLHHSVQQTVDTQILQQVSNDLAVKSFTDRSNFSTLNKTSYYFDEEGQLLTSAANARYEATLQDRVPSLPGTTAADQTQLKNSLKWIAISIKRVDIPNAAVTSYSVQIAYH